MGVHRNTKLITTNTTLLSTDENIKVDVTSGPIQIMLPIATGDTMVNDMVKLSHVSGDCITNNITIISNTGDTTSIIGGDIVVDYNGGVVFLELTNNNMWVNFFNNSSNNSSTEFTGNTSGNCINDIYITNIHGCVDITVHSPIRHTGNTASGKLSVAFGSGTEAGGEYSHSEGDITVARGDYSHSEGHRTVASGHYSHAQGYFTVASGDYSHAEGYGLTGSGAEQLGVASGVGSHAEGYGTTASGVGSHSEGYRTVASGDYSHAEGYRTEASGASSHSEGYITIAVGDYSHSGGMGSSGGIGNSNGYTVAGGIASFAHFTNDTPDSMGAMADNSAILGGMNHNISSGATNSVILGGSGITATAADTVYVPKLVGTDIPAFADEAAAVAGGLEAGAFYQTDGTGAEPLNVAGILMIKQ